MLWLEADRLGWLLETMDAPKVDLQRDVVKNERRQSYENQPYGLVDENLSPALYPAGHPYSWTHDRLDGRPLRRVARGREGLLPHLLRAEQRDHRRRGRGERRLGAPRSRARLFAEIPRGPGDHAPDARALHAARHAHRARGPRAAAAPLPRLARHARRSPPTTRRSTSRRTSSPARGTAASRRPSCTSGRSPRRRRRSTPPSDSTVTSR